MLEHSMLYPKTTLTRRRISMDGMWKFCLDEKAVGEKEGWMDGIPGEEMIPVPASFQDFYTEKDIREYTGDFWYETDFLCRANGKAERFCFALERQRIVQVSMSTVF